jgi:hypothetical protein
VGLKACICILIAVLVTALLAVAVAPLEGGVSFTVSELSLGSDLNSIALFEDGSIAVGRSGMIAIAYADGRRVVEKPVDVSLLDVSCNRQVCMAVGEKGVTVIIDVSGRMMKPAKLSDDDLRIIRACDGRFYIASSRQVIEYSPTSGISAVFNIEALDILPADRLYILSRDGIYYAEGRGAEEAAYRGHIACSPGLTGRFTPSLGEASALGAGYTGCRAARGSWRDPMTASHHAERYTCSPAQRYTGSLKTGRLKPTPCCHSSPGMLFAGEARSTRSGRRDTTRG